MVLGSNPSRPTTFLRHKLPTAVFHCQLFPGEEGLLNRVQFGGLFRRQREMTLIAHLSSEQLRVFRLFATHFHADYDRVGETVQETAEEVAFTWANVLDRPLDVPLLRSALRRLLDETNGAGELGNFFSEAGADGVPAEEVLRQGLEAWLCRAG